MFHHTVFPRGLPFLCAGWMLKAAFDSIPYPVLFKKAMGVLSEKSWKLLYEWYSDMTVRVKWNVIGCDILVEKGTRQGGLTSPMLFNLLYKDLIDRLANYDGGIAIGSMKYNVICYADDILLISLSSSGLQGLIDCAVSYVREHGLSFNSFKTKCCIIGKNPFSLPPKMVHQWK